MCVKLSYKGTILEFDNPPTAEEIQRKYNEHINKVNMSNSLNADNEGFPLSFTQQSIWFLSQMNKESNFYTISFGIEFKGILKVDILERSINRVVKKHTSLQSVFYYKDGVPYQKINKDMKIRLSYTELEGREDGETLKELDEVIKTTIHKPFNLELGPLVRLHLVKVSNEKHVLIFNMHHIIADGPSVNIFAKDVCQYYEKLVNGDNEEIQVSNNENIEFAIMQNKVDNAYLEKLESNWINTLKDSKGVLDFPFDYSRKPIQDYKGSINSTKLNIDQVKKIRKMASKYGASLNMFLLTIYNTLLYKYTRQKDIIVGIPLSYRDRNKYNDSIGCFVNMLPLRTRLSEDLTFEDLLSDVKSNLLELYDNKDYPFSKLVEKISPERQASCSPMFQFVMGYQKNPFFSYSIPELSMKSMNLPIEFTEYDLILDVLDNGDTIDLDFTYSTALFSNDTVKRIINHYSNLLTTILENPKLRLCDIQLTNEEEKKWLLSRGTIGTVEKQNYKTLHEIFEEQALKNPHRPAVITEEGSYTFAEVNSRANKIARYLRRKGVEPNNIVAVHLTRSLDLVVGILGILKAGGAYVPLDTEFPNKRIEPIIEDTNASIILTQQKFKEKLSQFSKDLIIMDDEQEKWTKECDELENINKYSDLAYILFTSGTTGRPKGVMIDHYSVINRIKWMQNQYQLNNEDIIMHKTPVTFDVSVWELFWGSLCGASIFLLPQGKERELDTLIDCVNKYEISVIHFVSSTLGTFLEYVKATNSANKLKNLKRIVTGAEALHLETVNNFRELLYTPFNIDLCNLYGPTEATIDVTYFDCFTNPSLDSVPIGQPISNTQLFILDDNNQVQPIGVPGELCISGHGLSRGYINRPELTESKFVSNPYLKDMKMYRTGDLARWLADGNIEYLGRLDNQVKIRGYRIELGDIENVLHKHPFVKQCVVSVKENLLVAHVVLVENQDGNNENNYHKMMRGYMEETLPSYMIPSHINFIENIPVTSSGKVNRKELNDRVNLTTKITNVEYVEPGNEVEKKLAEIWGTLLNVEKISRLDSFFDIGGHSLLVPQLVTEIRNAFDIKISIITIFEKPILHDLAYEIEYSSVKGRISEINNMLTDLEDMLLN